ncbi:DUF4968 domain-containing protein [Aquibacillus halophilus]|uniref:DUF4968 domain-containing protein n=1 Tax=Aquibacillus halophilus TaxID=930132 RepID=A0A6A8DME6_9BACI|nr:glycoside hydrolase family 31 protein [Aquibacillus halophilus]MRH44197.1 DUF4968 domain-containing protein [Aquibacillus halophilus]
MLEDTSFAIHPGKKGTIESTNFIDIGNVTDVEKQKSRYLFTCTNGYVYLTFYRQDIVRITMHQKISQPFEKSRAVIVEQQEIDVTYEEKKEHIGLSTKQLKVGINKSPFRVSIFDENSTPLVTEESHGLGYFTNGEVICYKTTNQDDHFYGFGEKTGFLDKKGEKYEMWNSDVYAPHNPETDPLYESIPYFMTLRDGRAHGIFFDNTSRTTFDMKSAKDIYSIKAETGQLDYYVFAGPSPKDVLEQYTYLTGRMPIPPKWALGYHQSRYSYQSEHEVRELAANFIKKEIPVDVIYLDIHYMDGYRVFTFDNERFPNPQKLIADLKQQGIRVVPIVDPGVKKDPEYNIYQEGINQDHFCKYLEGNHYFGDVWPGTSTFPDFTDEKVRNWWGEKHSFYSDLGIEGIWNDMNEPAVFNETKTMDVQVMHKNDGKPDTHRALHNVYGLLMGEATYEGMKKQLNGKRPFLLTRAGYSGVQRYASVWTGDNRSFWEHLQMSLPMCMNLGLSGVAFTGPDVGGFAHDTNAELLTRWTQVGAFTPYFRNHSAIDTQYQEPWQFGEKYEEIMKKYIQLRYKWMPQLYSLFQSASTSGAPVMRPLLMEYPNDAKTYNLNDQFMIGDNVIVAPVMSPGITDRAVYLPSGDWVDYVSGEAYSGNKVHLIHAELDQLPIFIKQGSAIVQGNLVSSMEYKQTKITIHIYPSDKETQYTFTYYDDDGETFAYQNDQFIELGIEINCSEESIELDVINQKGSYQAPYSNLAIQIHGLNRQKVYLNDSLVKDVNNLYIEL